VYKIAGVPGVPWDVREPSGHNCEGSRSGLATEENVVNGDGAAL